MIEPQQVASTDDAVLKQAYNWKPGHPTSIYAVPNEQAIGVSFKQYVVSVTDNPGSFAQPEHIGDVKDTIELGWDTEAVNDAIQYAHANNYPIDSTVTAHHAILKPEHIDITTHPFHDNRTVFQDLQLDHTPDLDHITFSYNDQTESFHASVWDLPDSPIEFGTTPGQYPTVEALVSDLNHNGHATSATEQRNLQRLQKQTVETLGDHHIVATQNDNKQTLHLVTPNNKAIKLPDHGNIGDNPTRTAKTILDRTIGAEAANAKTVQQFADNVIARLPKDSFSLPATSISQWARTPQNTIVAQPNHQAIKAATNQATAAKQLEIPTPRPGLSI